MLLFQVDAFTDTAFAGNPAAVCLLTGDDDVPEDPASWMQAVAQEMNLSETAFLRRTTDEAFSLRWFTPTHEVDLCGHATLAAAHVLWSEGDLAPDETARFDTASGRHTASLQHGDPGRWIRLDFPTDPVSPFDSVDVPDGLLSSLHLSDADVVSVGTSARDLVVHVPAESLVRGLHPDLAQMATLDTRGVIVTAEADGKAGDAGADVVSRFFGPAVGVPEDPVTGSAHCALAPYWAARLGRTALEGHQISARGGRVRMHLDAADAPRVALDGQAVTVFQGRLTPAATSFDA